MVVSVIRALVMGAGLLVAGVVLAGEQTVTLAVENMTCESCPFIVKRTLAKVEGVRKVDVSYARKTATVTFDDGKVTVASLIDATTRAGYPAQVTKSAGP